MSLEGIRAAMRSQDTEHRRAAIALLSSGWSGDEGGRDLLFDALADADWRVRRDAMQLGERVADASFVEPLLAGVAQGDNVGLRNACVELARSMGATCAEALADALKNGDPDARRFFVEALGRGHGDGMVEVLATLLESPDESLCMAAIDALARVQTPSAIAHLHACAGSESEAQRLAALEALEALGERVAFDILEDAAARPMLWRAALPLLGRSRDPRAAALAARGLAGSRATALEAATALCRLAENDASAVRAALHSVDLSPLIVHLEEVDSTARAAFAGLFLHARDPRAWRQVVLSSAERLLPRSAMSALLDWGDDAVASLLAFHAEDGSVSALDIAAELCASLPDSGQRERVREAAWAAIEESLSGFDALACVVEGEDVERVAGELLSGGHAGFERVIRKAAERAPDHVDDVLSSIRFAEGMASVVELVASIRGARAFEQLKEGLGVEDPAVRTACVEALPTEDARTLPLLRLSLSDEDRAVQVAAAHALGSPSDPDLARIVRDLLAPSEVGS